MRVSVYEIFRAPVFERNPRKGSLQPEFLMHRFPVKGGLRLGEVLMRHDRNVLLNVDTTSPEFRGIPIRVQS